MADDTTKIDATTQKIAETVKKVNAAMADSADLASKMVGIFKKLNVEMEKNQNILKLSNSFNKQILSDTKARAMIEDQMASDIKDAEKTILKAKMANIKAVSDLSDELNKKLESAQKSKLKNDAMAMANSRNILELENKRRLLSEKYNLLSDKNSTSAMLIKKQMMSSESEWTGLIKERNNLSERGAKIDDNIWRTSENIKDAAAAYIKETENAIKNAEVELKLRQDLLKNIRLQMGFMAHVERGGYAILGPFGEMVTKAKQFSENIKVIPKRFMLLDALIKSAIDRFVALDKAAEDFRKTTGFTNTQMVELRKNVEAVNKDFAALGVSIEVAYKAAQALTDVFGRTSLVTKDAIENIALMSANLGVVEADSAEVLSIFQGMGGATQEVAMNTMMAGAALSEKTGVPFSKVMGDIAKSSGTTAMLLGTTPSKLMKAAIAARALGTDLNTIAAQQEKLLNYSDSINSELEASALLGRSISFQRARQLAYEGKVEESAKATLDMVKQAGDFNEMNIYQRKALAAASGMELKDLTKMMAVEAQKNEIRMKGTPEQKKQLEMQEAELKKLRETNDLTKDSALEENKKAIAQAKIQGLMTQINGILDQMKTIIADIVEPIITPLAKVMIPLLKVIGMLIKGIAIGFKFVLEPIVWIAEGIGSMVDGAASFGKSIDFVKDKLITLLSIAGAGIFAKIFFGSGGPSKLMSMVSTPLKFAKDAVAGMMGKGAADPSKGLSDLSKGAEKVPSKSGVKDFLSDLAAGLKKMGDGKVLFGALNLIPASIGLIAMIPAAIGMAAIGVTGQLFAVGAKGLATGLSALANPKVLLGTLALLGIGGAFALFGLGAKLVADAFVSIAAVIPDAIAPLTQLALLSPLLYVAAGGIGALAVGLGVLAAATIPATVASVGIYIIAKSVEKLGSSFEQVSKSTISLAKSIPTVINPIKQFASIKMKETAEGMMLLSNSLASFGVGSAVAGIGSFVGNFLGGDPIAKMEKLASISDRLKDAASAISLIATATSRFSAVDSFAKSVGILADSLNKLTDSLGDIKTEELAKLSTIAGATGTRTEAAPATTMSTEGIEAKLDKLTELLIGGAVKVHIDGKLVSSAMANTAGR